MTSFLIILLFLSVFVEGAVTSTPLVLVFLTLIYILKKESWIFILAFFSGIILDMLIVREVGLTSIFFVFYVFLIKMYERKFEIESPFFIFFSTFFGSFFYLFLFDYSFSLFEVVFTSLISLLFFYFLNTFKIRKHRLENER